ncbi:hypothetical protein FACS1894196_2270 [Clostridia bacterium]|nr:hypothetical protein FACS1894196_2270 [Clostridia bacterium]
MRYHIDTIPVWDAYRRDTECPLCDLRAATEQGYLEDFLGASVMEPSVRIEVNAKGFCAGHFARMLGMKNRLGLALMTHTHLKQTLQSIDKAPASPKRRAAPEPERETCILCERLNFTMERYLYTVCHLWKTDAEFQKTFVASKGLCLPHYRQLLAMAAREMDARAAAAFTDALARVQRENMARIEKELEWFTLKFDYRNADKPWGTSKDAPERAIEKLRGK